MNNTFKGTKNLVLPALLILLFYPSHANKIAYTPFGAGKIIQSKKEREETPGNTGMPDLVENDKQFGGVAKAYLNYMVSAGNRNSLIPAAQPYVDTLELNHNTDDQAIGDQEVQRSKRFSKTNEKIQANKARDVDKPRRSERKEAIVKGIAIILMAVLAAISTPVLGTLTASIGLVGIFLLDILISIGIYRYYRKERPKLAKATGFLRLLYSAVFAIGIGYHIAGNVPMFNKLWQIGLIGFGLHLIALGILFNNQGGKKWVNIAIKSLLITAGIGYMILNIGVLVVPDPASFRVLMESIFILPMMLSEICFAIWMIIKGGKKHKK